MDTRTKSSKAVLETVAMMKRLGLTALPIEENSKLTSEKAFTADDYVSPWEDWTSRSLGVGIVLGGRSQTIDIDVDDPRLTQLCVGLLPPTKWQYGRKSKKSSHFIYKSSSVAPKTHNSDDPTFTLPLKTSQYRHCPRLNEEGKPFAPVVIEFRGDKAQSVMPGTLHEETGELVTWEKGVPDDLPPEVDPFALRDTVKLISFVPVVADLCWSAGSRHEATLYLTGMMIGAKWEEKRALTFFKAMTSFVGERDVAKVLKDVKDTYARRKQGVNIGAGPKLVELMGTNAVVRKFRDLFCSEQDAAFEDYDDKYTACLHVGGFGVMVNAQVDDVMIPDFSPLKLADFYSLKMNDYVYLPNPAKDDGKKIKVLKSKIWLENSRRTTYERTVFEPGGPREKDGTFNLWRGWAQEPDATASCARWLHHLRHYITNDNEEAYNWVLDWCADIIQDPMNKPGTAIVLCSKEGTGKNSFVTMLSRVLGIRYYREITNSAQLTGKFNSQLETALLVMANEATFAKDPRHSPILNSLISDSTFLMEKKHASALTASNYMRLVMASNRDHVIERSLTDRRYMVLDVGSAEEELGKPGAKDYFDALHKEIQGKGPQALMAFLLARKYDKATIRRPLVTKAAHRQTLLSMSAPMQFWAMCLNQGKIDVPESGMGSLPPVMDAHKWHHKDWPAWIGKTGMTKAFQEVKGNNRVSDSEFWVDFYANSGIENNTKKYTTSEGTRMNCLILPPLEECIKLLNEKFPQAVVSSGDLETNVLAQEDKRDDEL